MLVDYNINPSLYAKLYANLDITGTQFLAFRDIPLLISTYLKGSQTLDYGCGAGKSTMFLKSLGLLVEGVDINCDMIKIAQQKDKHGIYLPINSGELKYHNNTFDLVFASWVLMEVSTKDEMRKIVSEIYRVLKIEGIFITIVCTEEAYKNDWLTIDTNFLENNYVESGSKVTVSFKHIGLTIYDYFWTTEDYTNIMMNTGFKLLEVYKPLGKKEDKYNWKDEYNKAPFAIYVCKKQS